MNRLSAIKAKWRKLFRRKSFIKTPDGYIAFPVSNDSSIKNRIDSLSIFISESHKIVQTISRILASILLIINVGVASALVRIDIEKFKAPIYYFMWSSFCSLFLYFMAFLFSSALFIDSLKNITNESFNYSKNIYSYIRNFKQLVFFSSAAFIVSLYFFILEVDGVFFTLEKYKIINV